MCNYGVKYFLFFIVKLVSLYESINQPDQWIHHIFADLGGVFLVTLNDVLRWPKSQESSHLPRLVFAIVASIFCFQWSGVWDFVWIRGIEEKGREGKGRETHSFVGIRGWGKEGKGEGWIHFPSLLINTIPPKLERFGGEMKIHLSPFFLSRPLSLLCCYPNKV